MHSPLTVDVVYVIDYNTEMNIEEIKKKKRKI